MNPLYIIIPIVSVLLLLALIAGVRLYLVAPARRRGIVDKFKTVKFAHRGLHNGERAENSLSAFCAAADAGFGIELDVRLTRDGRLVVFHDSTVDRMTGHSARVIDLDYSALAELPLGGTEDRVPLFSEVLSAVDGRVPLLIEIKQDLGEQSPVGALAEQLEGYHGDVLIESFNPKALREFKRYRPDLPRGILSSQFSREENKKGKILYFILENMLSNCMARPDFIAYEKDGYRSSSLRFVRRIFGTPLFAWTVKSAEEEEVALGRGFDSVIFEGYLPNK